MWQILESIGLAALVVVGMAQGFSSGPPPSPVVPDTAFHWTRGSRIHTTNNVYARTDTLGLGTKVLRSAGTRGTITGGPAASTTIYGTSWFIHYDTPPDGWSSQQYLALDSLAGVPPAAVSAIRLSAAGTIMITSIGGTWQAHATVVDSLGNSLPRPVTWRSSSPAIASVDSTGLVTALSNGTDTISAVAEGKSNFFLVLVGQPATAPRSRAGISLDWVLFTCKQLTLKAGTCGSWPIYDTVTGDSVGHLDAAVRIP